jgi:hypothetical protein
MAGQFEARKFSGVLQPNSLIRSADGADGWGEYTEADPQRRAIADPS